MSGSAVPCGTRLVPLPPTRHCRAGLFCSAASRLVHRSTVPFFHRFQALTQTPQGRVTASARGLILRCGWRRLLRADRLELREVQIVANAIVASIGRQPSLPWPWALHSLLCGSGCCPPGLAFALTRRVQHAGAGLRPCPRCLVSRWRCGACGTSDGRDTERRRRLLRQRDWWWWGSIDTCGTPCTWGSAWAGWGCG